MATATPGFARFFGTSAAMPHAAAIAALVKAANPRLTPATIRTILTTTALDIAVAGVDRDSGAGLVNALAAVQAALAQSPQPIVCEPCRVTAGLVVGTVETGPGVAITIPVEVRNAPNAVETLGFDVTFDPKVLRFTGFARGPRTAQWSFFDVSSLTAGRLRVAAATIQQPLAAAGSTRVLDLHFEVLACQAGQTFPLMVEHLVDNVETWDSCAGCITCTCAPNGDVNVDGRVTPADALLGFQHFLGFATSDLNRCQQARANVLDPGRSPITPADALCIFRKFLGLPSCLD